MISFALLLLALLPVSLSVARRTACTVNPFHNCPISSNLCTEVEEALRCFDISLNSMERDRQCRAIAVELRKAFQVAQTTPVKGVAPNNTVDPCFVDWYAKPTNSTLEDFCEVSLYMGKSCVSKVTSHEVLCRVSVENAFKLATSLDNLLCGDGKISTEMPETTTNVAVNLMSIQSLNVLCFLLFLVWRN